jgi:hypothetical protein
VGAGQEDKMTKREQEMHTRLIRRLEDRVKHKYSIVQTEVAVQDLVTGESVGEIDLVGIVAGTVDLYEVKVNDGMQKAKKQLFNLQRYLRDTLGFSCEMNLYYYSGKGRKIVKVG